MMHWRMAWNVGKRFGYSMPSRKQFAVMSLLLVLTLAMAATIAAFGWTVNPRGLGDPGAGSGGGPATPPPAAGPAVSPTQGGSSPPAPSSAPAPSVSATAEGDSPVQATIAISGTGRDLERTISVQVTRQPQAGHRLWLVAQFPGRKGPPLQSPWERLAPNRPGYSIPRSFKDLDVGPERSLFIVDADAKADKLMADYMKRGDEFKGLPSGALQVSNSVDATRVG
ncbi:hypothetical protein [Actinoallomurus iriomotensis]|uniref:Uncharacterized protein n=1 Tax=Actinoallomurus iriomotensis TaxID=478107 RepID=A0A9W6RPL7_9ACTN|nr:hypothetical protein [Actinoallomurus iriomotensis]GLY79289.1 hypothetical protein Airi01_075560 [Actinoallomurus iriomotensis]